MINKEIEEFKKYVSNFDMSVEAIDMKYNHTLRVVGYADRITTEVTDPNLKRLSLIGALLHDISRFKQWTEYRTFEDAKSFDHGDMGYEILVSNDYINNYVQNDYEKEVVLNAVKQHNKKKLELTGDFVTDYVAKVVKDADKLDIIRNQYNGDDINYHYFKTNEIVNKVSINRNIIDSVLNKELCNNKDTVNYFDEVVREIAFIFDINFKEAFKIVSDEGFIDIKIKVLREYDLDKEYEEIINKIEKTLKDFLKEKLEED